MPVQHAHLRADARFRILCLLRKNPELSQRELAHTLGISTGALYYLLKALVDKGLVKLGNFSSTKDKRRYTYLLTSQGIAEKNQLTRSFLQRKMQEYDALRHEITQLTAELEEMSTVVAGELG